MSRKVYIRGAIGVQALRLHLLHFPRFGCQVDLAPGASVRSIATRDCASPAGGVTLRAQAAWSTHGDGAVTVRFTRTSLLLRIVLLHHSRQGSAGQGLEVLGLRGGAGRGWVQWRRRRRNGAWGRGCLLR